MKASTAVWLRPIFEALAHDEPDALADLIMQASTPAAEAAESAIGALAAARPALRAEQWAMVMGGLEGRAVDWVRFGQLAMERLGWKEHYPSEPTADLDNLDDP